MKNVVILGCPRSGTSLFIEMFETLGWHTFFEPGADFVASRMKAAVDKDRRWAIKNPVDHWPTPGLTCNLDDMDDWVDNVVYLWIVRHPLDTICSLRPGLSGDKWSHQPYPRKWATLMAEPWHIRAAHLWVWCNELGFAAASMPTRKVNLTRFIRYEDLLDDPRSIAKTICVDAEHEPLTTQVDTFVRSVSRNMGGPEAKFQDQWSVKDHKLHVGRWKENLTYSLVEEMRPILGESHKRFGYELPPQV